MLSALITVKGELGRTYHLHIGGKQLTAEETFSSFNPSRSDEVIGHCQKAGEKEASDAIDAAAAAFKSWSKISAEERADYLFKAADIMRERRMELSAWMV